MEQRGVVLGAVATVLNAGGSALVRLFDAVAAAKSGQVPRGKRGSVVASIKACEKKLERVYLELGRGIALNDPAGQSEAAREAAIAAAAEYREEIATLKQRLQEIDTEALAVRDASMLLVKIKVEPAADPVGAASESDIPAATMNHSER
jgi:hypothetical protein